MTLDTLSPLKHMRRHDSWASDGSRDDSVSPATITNGSNKPLEPPILVYHESARSIVFRDHLRRASNNSNKNLKLNNSTSNIFDSNNRSSINNLRKGKQRSASVNIQPTEFSERSADAHFSRHSRQNSFSERLAHNFNPDAETVVPSQAGIAPNQIANFQPTIQPLPVLELSSNDEFVEFANSPDGTMDPVPSNWTSAEQEVVRLLRQQKACVKTIKNGDWKSFLHRFCHAQQLRGPKEHADIPPDADRHFNSFVTSTTLLPPDGKRMRCFGSPNQYTCGVVFALPQQYDNVVESEDVAQLRTETWSWPAGYSAKTEFNIDSRSGKLINGRKEALKPLSMLRQYNEDYINKNDYMVSNRLVSGLSQIPYNEVFLRVGGHGRIVNNVDVATGQAKPDGVETGRSLDCGVGLPIAIFIRTANYGHLISLLRTRSRLVHVLGEKHIKGIPLIMISPESGVRVLTDSLQKQLWKIASSQLNPFQNSTFSHSTSIDKNDKESLQQKVDELLELDDSLQELLTAEELARLAGGFGATDESVASILKQAMLQDVKLNKKKSTGATNEASDMSKDDASSQVENSHKLQDIVNEGLAYAVRSGDYHTSRQLLILYSLVASRANGLDDNEDERQAHDRPPEHVDIVSSTSYLRSASLGDADKVKHNLQLQKISRCTSMSANTIIPSQPPPPPLDTDRLRSATNSDGLLAVLGAAQVLKAMQDGSAKIRSMEVVTSLEEWVNYGEQSVAFRISSWMDQRAAQGDLKIATENNTSFMAFVSNKAISNRKAFSKDLKKAVAVTDFTNVRFLEYILAIVNKMNSPCLRLELLQYVLGLDNRYSVAHVKRSVELAATCLSFSNTQW